MENLAVINIMTSHLIHDSDMSALAQRIRMRVLDMVTRTNSSHIGSCYSIIEILTFLYSQRMNPAPHAMSPEVPLFFLSKGHAAAALYATLAEVGFFSADELHAYATNGSVFMSHINSEVPGVTFSTGSLGHALPVAVGAALSFQKQQKFQKHRQMVYVLLSDGELNEGSNWEALIMACQLKLSNLVIMVDKNNIQGLGRTDEIMSMGSLTEKFISFGAITYEINGHSYDDLRKCFVSIDADIEAESPRVIIAHTIKGKGVSFMEDTVAWHYRSPKPDEYDQAKKEIEENKI
jgi:transketolase